MSAEDDGILPEDEGQPPVGTFILPGAGLTTAQGIGSGAGTVTGSPVIPEPVVPPEDADAGSGSLPSRIEQVLAEDGRFANSLSRLSFAADDAGHVTVAGSLPDPVFKRSLLATIHAVPGVTGVTDAMD